MKYHRAEDVLPTWLIKMLQQYVSGEYIYIPQPLGERRSWGELSGSRADLRKRNAAIRQNFDQGASFAELAQRYYLAESTIRKIIYRK